MGEGESVIAVEGEGANCEERRVWRKEKVSRDLKEGESVRGL